MQLEVGQSHTMRATLGAADIDRFAELSGDQAPVHTNEAFARAAGFAGRVVHGAHLVALVSRLVGMEFPGSEAVLERVDLSFRNPCYAPCHLEISATVRQVSEAVASVILDIAVRDEERGIIASGKTWHRLLEAQAAA